MTLPALDMSPLVEAIARRVVELLRGDGSGDTCDQDTLPAGVTRRRYMAAARRGELVTHKVGRRVVCKRQDLDTWIAGHPAPTTKASNDDGEGDLAHDLAAAGIAIKR